MLIEFKLSMPNIGSWNKKWSGEENYYSRIISFRGKAKKEKANKILLQENFYYNFGDGWGAMVSVRQVNSRDAVKIRKKSNGFYGYDWMINSIIEKGDIVKKI